MTPGPVASVVIADDDERFLAAMVELFDDEPGFEVVGVATTTRSLLDLATASHPDVAVVDVRMPGGGAPAAAAELRASCPRTVIVAVTAHAHRPDERLVAAGAIGPLAKGGAVAELLAAITTALSDQSGCGSSRAGGG